MNPFDLIQLIASVIGIIDFAAKICVYVFKKNFFSRAEPFKKSLQMVRCAPSDQGLFKEPYPPTGHEF
jgi:hypothetical protein